MYLAHHTLYVAYLACTSSSSSRIIGAHRAATMQQENMKLDTDTDTRDSLCLHGRCCLVRDVVLVVELWAGWGWILKQLVVVLMRKGIVSEMPNLRSSPVSV
ncbi:hypothetical protein D6D21_06953 [Aureobasidium pullulans]|uniref:Uncharacterized protein n=1 Tax=Aureobasidium pullulans TaxID=5580 RepID=A0AB74ISY3_AURPU|nr:hypothetical protein D6D21_06953 [Aureobasidium pullulans]